MNTTHTAPKFNRPGTAARITAFVAAAGMTTLLVSTVVMNLSPGSYLASVGALARPSDLVLSLVKAAVFGARDGFKTPGRAVPIRRPKRGPRSANGSAKTRP